MKQDDQNIHSAQVFDKLSYNSNIKFEPPFRYRVYVFEGRYHWPSSSRMLVLESYSKLFPKSFLSCYIKSTRPVSSPLADTEKWTIKVLLLSIRNLLSRTVYRAQYCKVPNKLNRTEQPVWKQKEAYVLAIQTTGKLRTLLTTAKQAEKNAERNTSCLTLQL